MLQSQDSNLDLFDSKTLLLTPIFYYFSNLGVTKLVVYLWEMLPSPFLSLLLHAGSFSTTFQGAYVLQLCSVPAHPSTYSICPFNAPKLRLSMSQSKAAGLCLRTADTCEAVKTAWAKHLIRDVITTIMTAGSLLLPSTYQVPGTLLSTRLAFSYSS